MSGGLHGTVRGKRTLVDRRGVDELGVSALKPIGDIVVLKSVGKRWRLLVVCVGGVDGVGGLQVPVLFIKRSRLWEEAGPLFA